ncbi:MAG: DUF4058 family protein [Chloroflexi bacterium]|nr:DUF4058 family protein [Chloroflexota bacterium]
MRSPFPGMDPYLEDPGGWVGVHDGLIVAIRADLNRRLGPEFVADAGTTVYVVTPEERRWVFPEVFVVEARQAVGSAVGSRIAAPVQVLLAGPETVSQPHIVIRDRASREEVTILAVLSPINKAPADSRARSDFLRKRAEVVASRTHWVEIDLLRAGERPPEVRGAGDFYVLVKRAGTAVADVWPIGVRDRLPTIGVPLRDDLADVPLDLQSALDGVWADGRYADLVDYAGPPPPPALAAADARWAAERVRRWRAAVGQRRASGRA